MKTGTIKLIITIALYALFGLGVYVDGYFFTEAIDIPLWIAALAVVVIYSITVGPGLVMAIRSIDRPVLFGACLAVLFGIYFIVRLVLPLVQPLFAGLAMPVVLIIVTLGGWVLSFLIFLLFNLLDNRFTLKPSSPGKTEGEHV
jgi:hypothetical protein